MPDGSITGIIGAIKWSYYTAAAINGYTVTRTGSSWALRATVILSDSYKLSQRPLYFVAEYRSPQGIGAWTWPIREYSLQDGQLRAALGPPEP